MAVRIRLSCLFCYSTIASSHARMLAAFIRAATAFFTATLMLEDYFFYSSICYRFWLISKIAS
jgi:hypothetical protein